MKHSLIIGFYFLLTSFLFSQTSGCPGVVAGGLGLGGADLPPIDCASGSNCVDIEATYLDIAETTNYDVTSIPHNPPTPHGVLANRVLVAHDDRWSDPQVVLPFDFCFYGNSYSEIVLSSNAVLSFNIVRHINENNILDDFSNWFISSNLPYRWLPLDAIFVAYNDIYPLIRGNISWELVTYEPDCRALVVSFFEIPLYKCDSKLHSSMVVLYENTNVIDIYVKRKSDCPSWNGGNAIIGIQNSNASIAHVPPNRNALDPNWTVTPETAEAWRFTPSGSSGTTVQWYEGSGTSGTSLGTTDVISVCPSETTTYTVEVIYTLCDGTQLRKTDETVVTVKSIGATADTLGDIEVCDSYTLPVLISGSNYYTGTGGTGTMLNAGDAISSSQTIYIYAETGSTPNCSDENSFDVTIHVTPTADTLGDIEVCDSYTLPVLISGSNYYTGTGGTGTMLNAGDAISSSQTIYIYAETGSTPNCSDENSFDVTIHVAPTADTLGDIEVCDSYTLPVLISGSNYYTGTGGTGTMLNAGDAISSSQTIYIYAETGSTPNCSDENSFDVTIHVTPTADTLGDIEVCDSYTLPVLISGSNYYTGTGGTGTMLNAGDAISSSQTIYIYAETGSTPNCSDENSFDVTIHVTPTADTLGDIEVCDSYTLPVLISGSNYYTGTGGTGTMLNAGDAISSSQTIYIYAETGSTPNCSDENSFDVTIHVTPTAGTDGDVTICDTDTSVINLYDLITGEDLGGSWTQASGSGGVFDTVNGTYMPAIGATTNVFVYTVSGVAPCVDDESVVTITINPTPIPSLGNDLEVCDDDNDGFGTFNLDAATAQIIGGNPNIVVTYHETQEQADNNLGALTSPYANLNEYTKTLYLRIEDTSTGCVYSQATINLEVVDSPSLPDEEVVYALCDEYNDTNDGIAEFDLTYIITSLNLLGGADQADFNISYHTDEVEALANVNAIANPTSFINTIVPEQIIYVRVESIATDCVSVKAVILRVDVLPIAEYLEITECDEDTWHGMDGINTFNLNGYIDLITGSATNVEVSFYWVEADAEAGSGASLITDIENVQNTMPISPIFVRVYNPTIGCHTVSLLILRVESNPTPSTPDTLAAIGPMEVCDGDVDADVAGDGYYDDQRAIFDLTAWEEMILTGDGPGPEADVSLTYHESMDDAESGNNAIATLAAYENIDNSQRIYVRATDDITGCYTVTWFDIEVPVLPVVLESTSDILCIDENGIPFANVPLPVLTANVSPMTKAELTFEWSLDGVVIPSETDSTLTVNQAGEYTVTISDITNTLCVNEAKYTIEISTAATTFDANVTTVAFADSHQIVAESTGNGTYEYSLDGGPFQSDGTFNDVDPGLYTVIIQDVHGCGQEVREVLVIDYPKFFTPNGDGFNDTWQIIEIRDIPISQIYIFDRYGKLLKQLDPDGPGWDGTYNGVEMPSTDYWFRIEYYEGTINPIFREFRAHFSLKR